PKQESNWLGLEIIGAPALEERNVSDEIGHIGFIAARLGERGRFPMRWRYARMASTFASQSAEMVARQLPPAFLRLPRLRSIFPDWRFSPGDLPQAFLPCDLSLV